MIPTKYHRTFLLVFLLSVVVFSGVVQWSDSSDKYSRRMRAEAEISLLSGDLSSSLAAFRASQSANADQPGLSRLIAILETMSDVPDPDERESILAQMAEESIVQHRFLLAERIYSKLLEGGRRYFDYEQRLYLARWLRTGDSGQVPPFDYYSDRDLWRLYRQILLTVPPPIITTYDFTFDEGSGEFVFSCRINRFFPESRLLVRWSQGEREQDAGQWFFATYDEDVHLEMRYRPGHGHAIHEPIKVSVNFQKTPLLVLQHPAKESTTSFFDIIYPVTGSEPVHDDPSRGDIPLTMAENDRHEGNYQASP